MFFSFVCLRILPFKNGFNQIPNGMKTNAFGKLKRYANVFLFVFVLVSDLLETS